MSPAGRVKQYAYSQFGRPRGPLGLLVGRVMANRGSNVERTRCTVELLGLRPGHDVLEVGHGPGLGLEAAAAAVGDGTVTGVDHSQTMSDQAARRNQAAVDDGRLKLIVADAQHLPVDLTGFDRIFGVNVWLFWDDPTATIADLAGRLRSGGTLTLTFQARGDDRAAATLAAGDRIHKQMSEAGLVVERQVIELDDTPPVCIIGTRP